MGQQTQHGSGCPADVTAERVGTRERTGEVTKIRLEKLELESVNNESVVGINGHEKAEQRLVRKQGMHTEGWTRETGSGRG